MSKYEISIEERKGKVDVIYIQFLPGLENKPYKTKEFIPSVLLADYGTDNLLSGIEMLGKVKKSDLKKLPIYLPVQKLILSLNGLFE